MRNLVVMSCLCAAAFAQTTFRGRATTLEGTTTINPGSTYTKIFVFNPPQKDIPPAANHTNFVNNVMTQDAIDGVTVAVAWKTVETTTPSTTPCSSVGTDTCQQDSAAPTYYHSYDWTTVDGTGCSDTNTGSISQWFCFQYSSLAYKKVNIILYGIGDPGQQLMPNYVTSNTWITAVGASQDVLNTINAPSPGCQANYSGQNAPVTNWSGDGMNPTTVTVTGWSNPPLQVGDYIWVKGSGTFPSSLNITGRAGGQITSVTPGGPTPGFTYLATAVTSASATGATGVATVSALESWPVPYEAPYSAGWLAFLKAAIYHFNHLNKTSQETTSNIGYIRPGVARRGEATPLCTTQLNTWGIYTAPTTWTNWYQMVNSTVQSANPQMQIIFAIDAGDPQSRDAAYATAEAGIAVATGNAAGAYNGFGSEGLEQTDTSYSLGSNCPSTNPPSTSENWGCMFSTYWSGATGTIGTMAASPTTVPLELQQADCSYPSSYSGGTGQCFITGPPGLTGDLRTLYTFAVSQHVSILELYYQDALLAYDPNYCMISGTTCAVHSSYDSFGSDFSSDIQYWYYKTVGQNGSGCTGQCYKDALNQIHGYH